MYIITTPLDPRAPINLRRLAFPDTFTSFQAARDFLAAAPSPDAQIDLTIHRWLGDQVDGVPFFRDEPLSSAATLLPLPSHGGGCRDEHRPLLKLAEDVIGQGLPLDALTKGDQPDPDDWRILDDDRGEVLDVTVRVAFDSEGRRIWRADDSCQDSGNPWPARVNVDDVTEAVNEHANNLDNPPDDDAEEGDEGDACYVAVFDGEVIGCYDDLYDAADRAINDRLSESRYGYPWAWNWAYYLGERSENSAVVAAVKAAGYTVAEQTATGYLFAGVDGGGYDFDSAHKAPLGAALSHLWYQLVDGCIPVGPAL